MATCHVSTALQFGLAPIGHVHFETYFIHRDDIGLQFANALAERARTGVRVRLLYDWLGSFSVSFRRRWPMLARAGVAGRGSAPRTSISPAGSATGTWTSRSRTSRLRAQPERRRRRALGLTTGRGGRAAAGALGIGSAVGAAITNRRVLGPAEAKVMASAGLLLLAVSGVSRTWPRVLAVPVSVMLGWVALSLLFGAATLRLQGKRLRRPWRRDGAPGPA